MAKKKPKKKTWLGLTPGDVYAGRVPDGRYAAVRVLKMFPRGAWLACTTYLGAAPPAISDRSLRKVLRRNSFHHKNEPALIGADTPLPDDFIYVGNIPLTAKESTVDLLFVSFGPSWAGIDVVFDEWRWKHDREAFEREVVASAEDFEAEFVAARRKPPGRRKRTPRSKLTEADFWKLIEATSSDGDLTPVVRALAKRSAADIREFEQLLAHKLYLLDTEAHAKHAGDSGISADGFLYARCFVVANGRTFYKTVLREPRHFPADEELEALLYVAWDAYEAKTGDELDEDTHYSYETGSNARGWPD